ncbi:aspartate aminotransferase family protein [Halomonas saccharevitans]|uniref:Aspartate aminotransferase family protein n=1 Tax=Halomonas saccharevitans TaxID=416872 RepID=A0ABU3NKX9_9GAMM|nr:aspartate aminotransferase family protein [Halomonas saccharevitans]MDT8880811.1 aspartate aminotransferase family protein [Halomonas saccharevitans]
MSHVFHRHLKHSYPTAVGGEGPYLIDAQGQRYLDACGGAAVSCLGHSDAEVIEAVRDQIGRLAYAHTSFFTNEPMEALADFLVERAPSGLSSVYFVSGGSEAVESALKLARQYFIERGEPQRKHLIARRQSYHGNTLGALATGGNAWRRQQFEPLLVGVSHVSPCYAYRGQAPGETSEAYGERLAAELEAEIQALGPETVMAFVAEPVVGATLGAVPPVPGYFKRVREICDRHGILLILDEVMCGMGRTGTLFAAEQEGVTPDLLTVAKGLGAGYQPIGATLVGERIRAAIAEGSGFFQHGHTYIGHATACAAALAVQRAVEERGLLSRVVSLGEGLQQRLEARFGEHPHVGDIRGRGLFRGLELVAERDAKTPFAPERKLHAAIKRAAMDEGLMCYPMGGTLDGRRGDHILLAPPFILDDAHLDEIVDKLDAALKRVLTHS